MENSEKPKHPPVKLPTPPILHLEVEVAEVEESKSLYGAFPIWSRLGRALSRWREITLNKTVLSWIEFGVPYEFVEGPPPPRLGVEYPLSIEQERVRDAEFARYLRLGAIAPLPPEDLELATFNGVFVVSTSKKDRPIIDQRYPNSFQKPIHFKMDSIRDVRDLIKPYDYMFTFDLKDAYLHLRYRRPHWKYSAFWWKGKPWCFVSMMFGHCHAPRWWTKLMRPVMAYLREKGIRCVIYFDDILILAGPDFKEALRIYDLVLELLLELGLTVNMRKSSRRPSRRLIYIGFVVDSRKMTFSVESKKILAFQSDVRRIVKRGDASARDLARVLGKITAMSNAILPWRLRTRATLLHKNQVLRAGTPWDLVLPISETVTEELKFWLTSFKEWNGKSIHQEESKWTTISDSSGTAFGGRSRFTLVAHSWEEELEGRHSTLLETIAASRVIKEVVEEENLREGVICHLSDNTTTVSYLEKQGGRVPEISQVVEGLWEFCLDRGIIITAKHVPGLQLSEVDYYSRMRNNNAELSLCKSEFDLILKTWGDPEVDLFATRFNNQCEKFVTLFPDPRAYATDAFSLDWRGLGLVYAFPPFNQIGRVLAKLYSEGGEMILVVPDWKGAVWSPGLEELKIDQPLRLTENLVDLDGRVKRQKWNLTAWLLSRRI
jgi:hypothetical protein